MIRTALALCLLAILPSARRAPAPAIAPEGVTAKQTAEEVDRHYNAMHSLSADFTQTIRDDAGERSESGHLLLLRPGRMRWEYRTPREKLFVTDGKTAWLYVQADHQARRMAVKKLDDLRSPLRFLLGHAQLAKEFEPLQFADGATVMQKGNVVLTGTPKHKMGGDIARILFEVTPQRRIVRIIVEHPDGGATEFVFAKIEENPELEESLFRFKPAKGVEVIDAAEFE